MMGRIGIRSFDKKRYYYYAHLRQNYPYAENLKEGDVMSTIEKTIELLNALSENEVEMIYSFVQFLNSRQKAERPSGGKPLDDIFRNIVGVTPDTGKTLEEYMEGLCHGCIAWLFERGNIQGWPGRLKEIDEKVTRTGGYVGHIVRLRILQRGRNGGY